MPMRFRGLQVAVAKACKDSRRQTLSRQEQQQQLKPYGNLTSTLTFSPWICALRFLKFARIPRVLQNCIYNLQLVDDFSPKIPKMHYFFLIIFS